MAIVVPPLLREVQTMPSARATTDHGEIRRWVEDRGGFPAHVTRTGCGGDPGVLRIDYPGFSGQETLERMDWEQWFDWFDRDKLAFLYQPLGAGRFSKLVDRRTARSEASSRPARSSSKKRSSSKTASTGRKRAAKKAASSRKSSSTRKRSSTKARRTRARR